MLLGLGLVGRLTRAITLLQSYC